MEYRFFIQATGCCWMFFTFYWLWMARNVKPSVYTQSKISRLMYVFFILFAFALLYLRVFPEGFLGYQLIPVNSATGSVGVIICAAGIAFAIWARKTLANNWSATVTLKEGHELIETGPYRLVRHPIYTGMLMGVLGPAIVIGQVKGFIALGIIFIAHLYKIRLEETVMLKQFPVQYTEYSRRVKRLVPFVF